MTLEQAESSHNKVLGRGISIGKGKIMKAFQQYLTLLAGFREPPRARGSERDSGLNPSDIIMSFILERNMLERKKICI
jgi:hypothetical protein